MKKILITGANGFIGRFLVEEAINKHFDVYAGIRKTSDISAISKFNIHYLELELSDKEAIKSKLKDIDAFDYVIHNAGITKTCNKEEFENVIFKNTQNLIMALIESGKIPKKFVYMSSLAAYGPAREGKEMADGTDEPKPVSIYGKNKLKSEEYIKSLKNFPFLIFRPTGVYGPGEKDYLVMYKNIKFGLETYVGTKNQKLSFLYVKDLARLIIQSLDTEIVGKTYFVTDLKAYTAQEFNRIVKEKLNRKTIPMVFPKNLVKIMAYLSEKLSCLFLGKAPTLNMDKYIELIQKNWLCDSSPLITDFDYKPEYDLKKGIDETIDWYKNRKLL